MRPLGALLIAPVVGRRSHGSSWSTLIGRPAHFVSERKSHAHPLYNPRCPSSPKEQGVRNPVIPAGLKKVLGEYIKDGYKWFVFDVVTVGDSVKTKDALRYRFKSQRLYYPLRITRTEKGDTDVRLIIVTEQLLDSNKCVGISEKRIERPSDRSRIINRSQLEWLDEEADVLLGHPAHCLLRLWKIHGKLSAFKEDLLVEK